MYVLAAEIDMVDVACEVDLDGLASYVNMDDLARHIAVEEVAGLICLDDLPVDEIAGMICLDDLSDRVVNRRDIRLFITNTLDQLIEDSNIDFQSVAKEVSSEKIAPYVEVSPEDVAAFLDYKVVSKHIYIAPQAVADSLSKDSEFQQVLSVQVDLHQGVAKALDASQVAKHVNEPWSFLCDNGSGISVE